MNVERIKEWVLTNEWVTDKWARSRQPLSKRVMGKLGKERARVKSINHPINSMNKAWFWWFCYHWWRTSIELIWMFFPQLPHACHSCDKGFGHFGRRYNLTRNAGVHADESDEGNDGDPYIVHTEKPRVKRSRLYSDTGNPTTEVKRMNTRTLRKMTQDRKRSHFLTGVCVKIVIAKWQPLIKANLKFQLRFSCEKRCLYVSYRLRFGKCWRSVYKFSLFEINEFWI